MVNEWHSQIVVAPSGIQKPNYFPINCLLGLAALEQMADLNNHDKTSPMLGPREEIRLSKR